MSSGLAAGADAMVLGPPWSAMVHGGLWWYDNTNSQTDTLELVKSADRNITSKCSCNRSLYVNRCHFTSAFCDKNAEKLNL